MTTETQGTVVLGFGPQPMEWISKASKLCGKDAVMDADVARMTGANLAAGTPAALDALRKQLEAGALSAQKAATPGLSADATNWLASGRRGLSSETIFQHLTGVQVLKDTWKHGYPWTPSDPSDVSRCRLLLEQVPELQQPFYDRMPSASKKWAALVKACGDICVAMDLEQWDKAYELIQKANGR